MAGDAQDAALAPLLAAAEASPFGHGGETKLDDKVRVARHITADKLQGVEDLLCDSVLAKITTELVPDSKGIRAVLHKLNFYGPGSFPSVASPVSWQLANIEETSRVVLPSQKTCDPVAVMHISSARTSRTRTRVRALSARLENASTRSMSSSTQQVSPHAAPYTTHLSSSGIG